MKKKLLVLNVVQLAILALAFVFLFLPIADDSDRINFSMFALVQEIIADFDDILTDPLSFMVFLYPLEVVITAIVVIIRSIKDIKYATAENAELPKKPFTNCILMLLLGFYAAFTLMLVWNNFGMFTTLLLYYVLPALALMVINSMIKGTANKIKLEAEKEAAVQEAAAKLVAEQAAATEAKAESDNVTE